MKKRVLFLALFGAISIASLTSCGNQNTSTITTETTPQRKDYIKDYIIEDSEVSKRVYYEVLKSYPDLTYDDFRLNGDTQYRDYNYIVYKYDKLSIGVNNNEFTFKTIEMDGKDISSDYINNEWIKTSEGMYINDQYCYTYFIALNPDGTFNYKDETTFDDAGNELVSTFSEYINNEWVIAAFRNNKNHTFCNYHLNSDGTYKAKNEYTYDDAGNEVTDAYIEFENDIWVYIYKNEYTYDKDRNKLTAKYSKYINRKWVVTKFEDYENNTEYSINLKADGTYKSKDEYTYDEYGGELTWTNYEYINNDWVTIKYRDYEHNTGCSFNLNSDGTYDSKDEYTYDKDRNKLTAKYSKYINRKWVVTKFEDYENNTRYSIDLKADGTYDSKKEYTFLEDGATSTYTMYKYINNDWVILYFKDYEHNTIYTIDLNSDETYKSKKEYTYDDNGVPLTVTNYVYVDGHWVLKS